MSEWPCNRQQKIQTQNTDAAGAHQIFGAVDLGMDSG